MKTTAIKLPLKVKRPVLAFGSQTKNTVCFAAGNRAFLSPVHGDLNDPGDFSRFTQAVRYFLKKRPALFACDLHPEYQSTKYAGELNAPRYKQKMVQHHHAHIASCMAENGLRGEEVIGVAFDGTGMGTDNTLWGAEFFCPCDYKSFKRRAHLREISLLGGQQAIREPWRLAALWLYLAYGERMAGLKIKFSEHMDKHKWRVLKTMYLSGFNAPLASSMGRLFDAVAALVLGKNQARFEAELAIELEELACGYKPQAVSYNFGITRGNNGYILDPLPMFKELVADLRREEPKAAIAYKFHLAVAKAVHRTCLILKRSSKINKVVLSGGVFQNRILSALTLGLLRQEGFRVFTQRGLSCNDSAVSLGQAIIAGF